MTRPLHLLLASLAIAAFGCADVAGPEKPASDPDLGLSAAKADRISNRTDIRGELAIGSTIAESIDYPSYYLGRTATFKAGQRFQVDLTTNRKSLVRMYGPSTGLIDGLPVFGSALVKAGTRKIGRKQVSSFAFDVPADGTYMLVYGPKWVWAADYKIDVTCLEGCVAADACEGDWDCEAGEFCGDNGVRCIRAPCDANYDICQNRHPSGGRCTRDGECGAGLACRNDRCAAQSCSADEDCDDGFCGCAEQGCASRICKDYAPEGESCGGFRMAHLVRQCGPEFACVAPYNIIADIPGHCGEMTTVAEVLANPRAFDGRFIAIQGVIDPNVPFCTKIACSASNQCCNACGASQRLYDDSTQFGTEGLYLDDNGLALGCKGDNCTWADHCDVPNGNAWVAGWFRLNGVTPRLEITSRYGY